VVSQAGGEGSWTLLSDDHLPVPPVEAYLSHLADQRRSPNTVRAYAFDLKDYFAYLGSRGLDWARLRYDELAGFKPWLRLPPAARAGEIAVLPSVQSACTESTINRKLAAVTSFYEFHARHGVEVASIIRSAARPVGATRTSFRPFLAHVRRSRPMRSDLRLREPMRVPHALTEAEVASFVGGCTHLRDRVLVALLNEAGLRIGEALGLRHEDVRTADGVVDVRARENANGARAKTWGRQVPVTAAWFRLHAEYLHREYGDLDSDYVFVGLWSRPVGRPLTYSAVADLFTRLSRVTGVLASPHTFRHTYATRLLRAGVKAEIVQKLLGHASVSTTIDIYAHLSMEDVRHELNRAGLLGETETS
jgi:integrase/recombinase XerD